MTSQPQFRNPSVLTFATEPARAYGEMLAFTALTPLLTRLPTGDGRPVMVLPGFTASDQSTAALRYVLARLDYSVHGVAARRAGLLAGYGPIERPRWQDAIALYEFYGLLELWCWWKHIGDHQRAADLIGEFARFA